MIGDNAYINTSSLLTPYNKAEKGEDVHRDAYNFYVSQLRIRIEMAFGLLTMKWQIFKKPLVIDFENHFRLIQVCMKLHNYCINERLARDATNELAQDEVIPLNFADVAADEGREIPIAATTGRPRYHTWNHPDYSAGEIPDVRHLNTQNELRERITQYIRVNDYRRMN